MGLWIRAVTLHIQPVELTGRCAGKQAGELPAGLLEAAGATRGGRSEEIFCVFVRPV